MINLLAEFTTKAGEVVQIYTTLYKNDDYTVYSGGKMVQSNLTAHDCIRYLCHRLEQK